METDVAERILTAGCNLVLEKEGFVPLQILDDDEYSLSHADDGVCHFYQDDLCELHRSEGISHKPVVCQLYPFTLVRTPRGIFVSLLYSCPAVVSGAGVGADEHREELTQLFELHGDRVPQLFTPDTHIQLTAQSKISWPEYMRIEQQLLKSIDSSDPVGSLLRMVGSVLPTPSESILSGQLVEVVQVVRANLLLDYHETTDFRILKPATAMERDCIGRFLVHQIHGKLLLVGPTLVSQLLIYAVGMAIFLDFLERKKAEERVLHFSFEHLHQAFELLEEKLLAQSWEFEKRFLDWERALLSGAQ